MQSLRLVAAALAAVWTLGASAVHAYKINPETQTVVVVSLADFDTCARDLGDGDACLEGLKAYVQKQPKDAFAAGKRARLQFTHWAALSFFTKAFNKGASAEQCSDPDVAMAVVSGLGLPSDNPSLALARKIAGDQCWKQLERTLVTELGGAVGGYYKSNTCSLIAEKQLNVDTCKPTIEAKAAPAGAGPTAPKGVDWKQLEVDPASGRVLRGSNGEEVFLIRTKPGHRELVLLKFKSIPGPWNGQVFVAVERPGGTGTDYVTQVDQADWSALTERDGSYAAYPKGVKDVVPLYLVPLDRGQKKQPTPADVAIEFAGGKPPAAAAKPAAARAKH